MKKTKKKRTILIFAFSILCLGVIIGGTFFFFGQQLLSSGTFLKGTTINGIDVGGLNKEQAQNLVMTKLLNARNSLDITLKYKDKKWHFKGSDFSFDNKVKPYVENIYNYFNDGNIIERKLKYEANKNNRTFTVSYAKVLTGLNEKIDVVANEIDRPYQDAVIEFNKMAKTEEETFVYKKETDGLKVDKETLYKNIDTALTGNNKAVINVPVEIIKPKKTLNEIKKNITKRAEFSTSYKKSKTDRKYNIKKALSNFNGMVVQPNEEVSFNNTTGVRSKENGYKKANIILNGVYVEGVGGGVCQASTTLYNALLLADIEITEVHSHSLPASYVPLAFDAMVSEGYSDLKFKNNTLNPIYIKTFYNDEKVFVTIFGEPIKDGLKIVRRAEFIGAIPHPGDRIIPDTDKKYSNKVTFKGEYLRLKYPQEGYHSKAYIDYYENGVLIEQKLIRDEIYKPQEGVIIEGTEEVYDGITLPKNKVKFIPPQEKTVISKDNVNSKINKQNPSELNP